MLAVQCVLARVVHWGGGAAACCFEAVRILVDIDVVRAMMFPCCSWQATLSAMPCVLFCACVQAGAGGGWSPPGYHPRVLH